jgi:hypothetical protein
LLSTTEILSISDRETDDSGAPAVIANVTKSEYGPICLPNNEQSLVDGYSSLPASLAHSSAPPPPQKHDDSDDSDSDVDETKHKRRPVLRPVALVALPPPFVVAVENNNHNYDRVPAPAVVSTSLNGSGSSGKSDEKSNEYDGVRVRKPGVYDIIKVPSSRTVYDQCESSLT